MEYLTKEGSILSLSSIRRNRIPEFKFASEKEWGYLEEYVADVNMINVSTVTSGFHLC